jgi:hypothetical protein
MKRRGSIVLLAAAMLLACSVAVWGQGGETPKPTLNLMLNPLGLVQFGPIAQLEVPITPNLYGLAHVRLHGLGLLSYLLLSDIPASYSFAVGSGVRYFFLDKNTPHAPYLGALVEAGYGPYSGDIGSSYEYQGSSFYLTLAFNGGYRWRFGSFIVEVGAYAGVSPTVWSQWHYVTSPSVIHDGFLNTIFFGMAELSIGWEI